MTSKDKSVDKPKSARKAKTSTVRKKVVSKKDVTKTATSSKKAASNKSSAKSSVKKKPVTKKLVEKKKQVAKKATSKKAAVKKSSPQRSALHKVDNDFAVGSKETPSTPKSEPVENISLHIKQKSTASSSVSDTKNTQLHIPNEEKLMSDTSESSESVNPVKVGSSNTSSVAEGIQKASVSNTASLPSTSKGASRSWWPILVIAGVVILGATSFIDYTGSGDSIAEEFQVDVTNTGLTDDPEATVGSDDGEVAVKELGTPVLEVETEVANKVIEEELPLVQTQAPVPSVKATVDEAALVTKEAIIRTPAPVVPMSVATDGSDRSKSIAENIAAVNEVTRRNMVAFNNQVAEQNRRWMNWARQQNPPLYYGIVPAPQPYQQRYPVSSGSTARNSN